MPRFYQKKLVTTCILIHRDIKKLFSQNGAVSVPIGMSIVSLIITLLTLGKHFSIKWSIAVLNDVLLKLGTHCGFKWILTADLKFWIKRENQKTSDSFREFLSIFFNFLGNNFLFTFKDSFFHLFYLNSVFSLCNMFWAHFWCKSFQNWLIS